MIRERLFSIIVILSALLFSFSAQAWCTLVSYSPGDQPAGIVTTTDVRIFSTMRMPKDIAVGTEFYRVFTRNDTYIYYRANCNNNSTYTNYYVMGRFVGGITPALSSWQGSSRGTVYQTGIAGIGMVVLTDGRAIGDKRYSFGSCYTKSDYSCNTYTSTVISALYSSKRAISRPVLLTCPPCLKWKLWWEGIIHLAATFRFFAPFLMAGLPLPRRHAHLQKPVKRWISANIKRQNLLLRIRQPRG